MDEDSTLNWVGWARSGKEVEGTSGICVQVMYIKDE